MMKASALLSLLGYSLVATFASNTARSEVLVDFGVNSTRVDADIATYPSIVTTTTSGYHVGAGVRRALEHGSGAARLELATPAYGYWLGGALEYDFSAHWAVSFDLRIGDKLARDNLLPSDPQGGRPDNFYDLRGFSLYLSHRFNENRRGARASIRAVVVRGRVRDAGGAELPAGGGVGEQREHALGEV